MSPVAEHPDGAVPDAGARTLLSGGQRVTAAAGLVVLVACLFLYGATAVATALLAAITVVYTAVLVFKLLMVYGSDGAHVIRFRAVDLPAHTDLPDYTVLVPLYREGRVLPSLLERLAALDYPLERLQVLLLVEEDDEETRAAIPEVLSPVFETVLIPPGRPRTKPKACNVGLAQARGEFCVIYDAEDRPEPDQLRKAVAAFRSLPGWVVCVQAELQYWNPWTNWLTRCFAAEYALNFSLFLPGLDRYRLPIPLGGTSNHFRTDALLELGGWDAHNVTEDADLGVRIARRGWGVRMMASVTEEEANSRLGNWIRQRSRWIKGYLQTWLVHMRSPVRLWRELGTSGFLSFHLTVGFPTFAALVNPVFWTLTATYLVVGPDPIAPLFPRPVLYLGMVTMVGGNLLLLYGHMAGCMERGIHGAVRTMLALPFYWALMSIAAYKAVIQLARPSRRHYWELTEHGLVEEEPLASGGARAG
ncbi:glycosyltransferase family 2 protein [Marinactinospora thermotolerans]|uniref:Glycosyltransferase, catalytic subunit of cellulose synthase and poly-beta-1,6-N-acetylglucosamine synthase n=1 Tax=Marinactinospora thermotolerans DSM 45154 TaxID=1122192 RepID=A0A1T4R0X7_9ACTN|nr:glycosyltransferase family 2 protein [Marinactinospora thermotolerans]SKA09371.1 Glycosyltransferase, catalytic subunit of cellulose synthase and poly-beta-1,6-N-acetylglucosamine synthase [Marinactinospora thermotolerans DSM 45154]